MARLGALRARGAANIDYEVALLEHMACRGAGVAEPFRPRSGTSGVMVRVPEGRRCLALFRYLDGEPPESAEDIELTGAGLARLHASAADYAGPPSLYALDVAHLLTRPLGWLLQAPTLDDDLRERFGALASTLEPDRTTLQSLSRVACHGDCHGGNSFVRTANGGRREAVFFDFDDAAPGYLAYDLAVFLWSQLLRGANATPTEEVSGRWSRYLEGYRRVRTLPAADIAAVPAFVRMRHVLWLGELASRRHHWGSEALARPWLRGQADLVESWLTLESAMPARTAAT